MIGLKMGIFVFQPDILRLGENTCLRLLMAALHLGVEELLLGEHLRLGRPESYLQESFFFFLIAGSLRRAISMPRRTRYVFLQIFSPCSNFAFISINSSFA